MFDVGLIRPVAATAGIRCANGSLVAVTPTTSSSFFGFYDLCPWSPDDQNLVMLRCAPDLQEMPSGHSADVCTWNMENGTVCQVGETTGWNWQHGARTMWLSDGNILFNDLEQGRQVSRLVSQSGRSLRSYDMSVSALHPEEHYAVSSNYERLALRYSTYGYLGAQNDHIGMGPDDDGLWKLELHSGRVSLLLSYSELCSSIGEQYSDSMFVTHPVFSPTGKRIAFFLIGGLASNPEFMRLLVLDTQAGSVAVIAQEKASHPAWIDDDQIWAWTRESSAVRVLARSGILSSPRAALLRRAAKWIIGRRRGALLSEGFYLFDLASGGKRRVAPDLLTEDGHFSRHPKLPHIVLGDTYPDEDDVLWLFLFSINEDVRVDIAGVNHGVVSSDPRLRCDLHPRWNRAGSQVCVDFSEQGTRGIAVFDARDAVAKLS
jgi:hypothetical protein